jgi:2-keto-3-deoxy-L-rhamnonate aldolase RhmA
MTNPNVCVQEVMMRENRLKRLLREGKVAVGTTVHSFATREIAVLLENCGLDWVMIDMEHSGYTIDTVADLLAWFRSTPIATIVRPPDNLYHLISSVLDAGANGVQCAHIETAEQARGIVDMAMYAPMGNRGVAFSAPGHDFRRPPKAEYAAALKAKNEETSIVAMIETAKGVENIDEIAAVDGIDIIQTSSNDLSFSLGVPGLYDHPKYKDALRTVSEACKRHGKAAKVNPHSDADIVDYYNLGFRVLGTRNTAIAFQDAIRSDADRLREKVANLK